MTPWQLTQAIFGIVFALAVGALLQGCTYVYVYDNDLGDVGLNSKIEQLEHKILGE